MLSEKRCRALLDTGVTVSTISEEFYRKHLWDIWLHLLEDLDIECASGEKLPFLGYIEVGVDMKDRSKIGVQYALFLVVPSITKYSKTFPVILGTNILQCCQRTFRDRYGERFLQKAHLQTLGT